MTEEQANEQYNRLMAIPPEELVAIESRVNKYVQYRIYGRTRYGAHTEKNLGLPPEMYYAREAINKLLFCEWEWKYDKYDLETQLKRIVGSLISEKVRKEKTKVEEVEYDDALLYQTSKENLSEEEIRQAMDAVRNCVRDREDLLTYIDAFIYCDGDYKAVSELLNISIEEVRNLQRAVVRRAKEKGNIWKKI